MQRTIQAESHKVELAFVHEYEFSDDVLEFWDQPERLMIECKDKRGRDIEIDITPDYFVIRADGTAGWEECKPEDKLEKLALKYPDRYCWVGGVWRSPPAEEAAEKYGLYFRIRSSAEICWKLQRNLVFLSDYLRSDNCQVEMSALTVIKSLVSQHPGLTLSRLITNPEGYTADDVYALVAQGEVFVDLENAVLAEPGHVRVYLSSVERDAYESMAPGNARPGEKAVAVTAEIGNRLFWGEKAFTVMNVAAGTIWMQDDSEKMVTLNFENFETLVSNGGIRKVSEAGLPQNNLIELVQSKSREELVRANERLELITEYRKTRTPATKDSTMERWIKRYRDAEIVHSNGYVGLFDKVSNRGNRTRRASSASLDLATKLIETEYLSHKQPRIISVYNLYCHECFGAEVKPVSYQSFCGYVKKLPLTDIVYKREGKRAAYQVLPPILELHFTTLRHGDRPFEIAHIDHTELDIMLVDSETGELLGRPWLTFMIDAFSRRVLAFYLTYEPPSYRSCMMVLRECVRRHNRFPQTIVVDGGKEFNGIYLETLMAHYECTKKTRPPAQACHGSVLERLFGSLNTQLLYNLLANTQQLRPENARQTTKGNDPRRKAVWTLVAVYERIHKWAYELYDQNYHSGICQSPADAFAAGMAKGGNRLFRMVAFNEEFIFMTLPTTSKGEATVERGNGIKVNYTYYWTDYFTRQDTFGSKVPVRYDPFDLSTTYAYVDGAWRKCRAYNSAQLEGLSEYEYRAIAAELNQRKKRGAENAVISGRRVASFLAETKKTEETLKKLRMASENKKLPLPMAPAPLEEEETEGVPFVEEKALQVDAPPEVYDTRPARPRKRFEELT